MKGWRTLTVNALSVALTVAEMQEWLDVIPDEYLPWFLLCLGLANMLLRWLTTTPVGRQE